MNKIELATIKPEFLKDDEADLTYVVIERKGTDVTIGRLHGSSDNRETRIVPTEWLNIFDQIENKDSGQEPA